MNVKQIRNVLHSSLLSQAFGDSQGEFSDRRGCVVPDVIENENNTKITIPQNFKADLETLKTYLSGDYGRVLWFNMTLSEMHEICPIEREGESIPINFYVNF